MRLPLALVAALLAAPASAQSLLWTVSGSASGDRCGTAVSPAGDVDADGFADFAVGLPKFDGPSSLDGGAVRVYGGANGFLLWTAPGMTGSAAGSALALIGDVSGDGLPDLAAGAPDHLPDVSPFPPSWDMPTIGAAQILSGANGVVLLQKTGFQALGSPGFCPKGGYPGGLASMHLGSSVGAVGDVDGDGVLDFAVCDREFWLSWPDAFGVCHNSLNWPTAIVCRCPSGAGLANVGLQGVFTGFPPKAWPEGGITGLGDVNGDGFRDVVGTSPGLGGDGLPIGAAQVFRFDGLLLYSLSGSEGTFGDCVANVGDVNADGVDDFAIGAPGEGGTGQATIRSGKTGVVLLAFAGGTVGDQFGNSVAGLGDIDLDGIPDIAVGASQDTHFRGYVRIFTGADGAPIATIAGASIGDGFGWSVGSAGDVDGDGRNDLIVGAPNSSLAGVQSGSAQVWSLVPTGLSPYGTGAAGCAGPHHLSGSLPPKIGQLGFEVRCDRAPANALGLGLLSYLPLLAGGDPFGLGVPLYVDLLTAPALTAAFDLGSNAKGYASVSFPIINDPSIVGLIVYLQALWIWPSLVCVPSIYGLSDTHGLSVTILPP